MLTNSSDSSCTLPDSMRSASSSISAVSHLLETSSALPPERAITRARSAARTNASAFTTSSSTSATFKNEDCLVDEWHVVDTNVNGYYSMGAGEYWTTNTDPFNIPQKSTQTITTYGCILESFQNLLFYLCCCNLHEHRLLSRKTKCSLHQHTHYRINPQSSLNNIQVYFTP